MHTPAKIKATILAVITMLCCVKLVYICTNKPFLILKPVVSALSALTSLLKPSINLSLQEFGKSIQSYTPTKSLKPKVHTNILLLKNTCRVRVVNTTGKSQEHAFSRQRPMIQAQISGDECNLRKSGVCLGHQPKLWCFQIMHTYSKTAFKSTSFIGMVVFI